METLFECVMSCHVKTNVDKAEAEKKTMLDKDVEVDMGVGEEHEASSSTEMSTGSGIKGDNDTDEGGAMTDVETHGKKMRVNRAVELAPAMAVVNEMDEESMDDDWIGVTGWMPTIGWSKTGRRVKRSSPRPGRRKFRTWWRS